MTTKARSSLLPQSLLVIALSAAAFGIQAQDKPAAGSTAATPAAGQYDAVFQRADANHDGKLSKEEAARIPAVAEKFDQLDKDKDGLLSLDELKAAETPK